MGVLCDAVADAQGQDTGDALHVAPFHLLEQVKRPVFLRAALKRATFLPNLPLKLVVTNFWRPPPRAFESA